MALETLIIKDRATIRAQQTLGSFFKVLVNPCTLIGKLKARAIIISWVIHRFKKHMAAKKSFIKQFMEQWSTFINAKINAEYERSSVSQTAKLYVSIQSWLVTNLAEYLFDAHVQRRAFGKYAFPQRSSWVQEVIEFQKTKKTFNSVEPSSIKDNKDNPSMMISFQRRDLTNSSFQKLTLHAEEDANQQCNKCNRSHTKDEKCIEDSKKTVTIHRPPSSRNSPDKRTTIKNALKPRIGVRSRGGSFGKPPKRKKIVASFTVDSPLQELEKKNPKLKSIFIVVRAVCRIMLAIENRFSTAKQRIMRRLKPKPWSLNKITCSLSQADLEHVLFLLGLKVRKTQGLKPL